MIVLALKPVSICKDSPRCVFLAQHVVLQGSVMLGMRRHEQFNPLLLVLQETAARFRFGGVFGVYGQRAQDGRHRQAGSVVLYRPATTSLQPVPDA